MPGLQSIAATLLVVLASTSAWAGDENVPHLTSSSRSVIAEGAAWGILIPLSYGKVGLIVERGRPLENLDSVNTSLEWLMSSDGGNSWSDPITISERLGFDTAPDGSITVYQQRNAAGGQLPSGRIVVSFNEENYAYAPDGSPVIRPDCGCNFKIIGASYVWSDDLGKTWSVKRVLPTGAIGQGQNGGMAPRFRIISLKDGTAMMSFFGSYDASISSDPTIPSDAKKVAAVIRSTDNGETWGDITPFFTNSGDQLYEETFLTLVGTRILADMRTDTGSIIQFISEDDGRSWAGPTPVTEDGQQPGGAFVLRSGDLMMTWGNRRPPYGAMAMLSLDDGETWEYSERISLAWDAANANSGYANGVALPDGNILVTYYEMPESPDYRGLWTGAKVYLIKFRERDFRRVFNPGFGGCSLIGGS
jgi:BNR repeat protein